MYTSVEWAATGAVSDAEAVVSAAEADLQPVDLGVFKRVVDVVGAALLLVLAAPILLAAAVFIAVETRGPVFFKQQRIGRGGRTFRMIKLRSMVDGADRMVTDLTDRNESDGLLFKVKD